MVFCYFCSSTASAWIDYSGQQDSGPRNLPELPDELDDDHETDSRLDEESMETETAHIATNAKVHDIQPVTPPDEEDNQNSLYDFEERKKVAKQNVNEYYDY